MVNKIKRAVDTKIVQSRTESCCAKELLEEEKKAQMRNKSVARPNSVVAMGCKVKRTMEFNINDLDIKI